MLITCYDCLAVRFWRVKSVDLRGPDRERLGVRMVSLPMPEDQPRSRGQSVAKRFESDARALVPVSDEIGGIVLYLNGQPAYYVLNGEWFEAIDGAPPRLREETSEEPAGDRIAVPEPAHGDTLSTF